MMDEIPQQSSISSNIPQLEPVKKSPVTLLNGILLVILLIVLAFIAVRATKWNPISYFSGSLKPEEVIPKMLDSITDIKSATYSLKFSFQSEQRDADAQPIDAAFPEYKQQKEAIKRDAKRLSSLSSILSELSFKNKQDKKYPLALSEIVGKKSGLGLQKEDLNDPQTGQQYGYRQDSKGADFTVAVQLETDAAARKYTESLDASLKYDGKEKSPGLSNKIIEVHKDSPRVYASVDFADISPFPLGLDFDGVYQYLPVEINSQLALSGQSETDATASNEGSYAAQGSLDLGGTTFKAGLDVLKKAQTYYVRVNEAPSLGFFDLAAVKNKWIRAVPEDAYGTFLGSVFYNSNDNTVDKKGAQLIRQYQLFFQILKAENLILVTQEFPQEKENKKTLYHYRILLDRSKLPSFYRRLTEESKKEFGDDTMFVYNEQTLTYLQSSEFSTVFDFLEKNVQLELWIDANTFLPEKISYSFRLVPPDSVLKLKDKQHRATLSVGVDSVNMPISVDAPAQTISVDEARMLLTGETLAEINLTRQVAQIRAIREALRNYYEYTGVDPKDIHELLKKINDTTPRPGLDLNATNDRFLSSYTLKALQEKNKPFLTILPKDIYTKSDYVYASDGKSYTLQYQIQLPPKKEDAISDYEFESRSREYAEGTNTATEKVISLEAGAPKEVVSSSTLSLPPGVKSADARIQSAMSQLRTLAEAYYDSNKSSYKGVDVCFTDPDTNSCKNSSTASSVKKLRSEIGASIGGVLDIRAHASAQEYCVNHRLNSGLFTCLDSTGAFMNSATTLCSATVLRCSK